MHLHVKDHKMNQRYRTKLKTTAHEIEYKM